MAKSIRVRSFAPPSLLAVTLGGRLVQEGARVGLAVLLLRVTGSLPQSGVAEPGEPWSFGPFHACVAVDGSIRSSNRTDLHSVVQVTSA